MFEGKDDVSSVEPTHQVGSDRSTNAWVCHNGRLSISTDRQLAPVLHDEVEVQVSTIGLCRTDLYAVKGQIPVLSGGFIPCHEFSGAISRIGNGVQHVELGDRVSVNPVIPCQQCSSCVAGNEHLCCHTKMLGVDLDGACCEKLVVPGKAVIKIPDALTDHEAVFAEPVAATLAIFNANIEKQQRGLVLGEGRIAELTLRVLYAEGFENTFQSSLDQANTLKSDSFDFVIETHSSSAMINEMFRLVKPHGQLVFKSRMLNEVSFKIRELIPKQPKIDFVYYGCFRKAVKLLSENKVVVRDLVGKEFQFSQFKESLAFAENNEEKKTMVSIGGNQSCAV